MKCPFFILLIMVFIFEQQGLATHNRAGEISFNQLTDLKIQVLVTTYTKTSSVSADRDSLIVDWGDGTLSIIGRTNGNGLPLSNDIKKNLYQAEHTYPGRGTYLISIQDPNRIDNILNIDPPNSVNVPFYIQTTVTLLNLQFQSPNHSVQLLQPPIDFACIGQLFIHNPSAYDEDGDSLVFELAIPLMDKNQMVPNYFFPNQIQSGNNNKISLNNSDGTFEWNAPQLAGEYNIAIIIHEYRKGIKIASTIRDMQIFVRNDCANNRSPSISAIHDTCIVAGMELNLKILGFDPDSNFLGSKIKMEAYGAPFLSNPPAEFSPSTFYSSSPIHATFNWKTNCQLIRKEYYIITIKVTDNYLDTTGLSYSHTIRIKIVGPPPENLTAQTLNNSIFLEWDHPYICDSTSMFFRGFSVWRKEHTTPLALDTCLPGLDGKGYSQIASLTNTTIGNKYVFRDTTIKKENLYCYRVLAEFARLSSFGFPYNFVSSLHSNESCNSYLNPRPLLLNTDILNTDLSNGNVFIKWTKPTLANFDPINNPSPYRTALEYTSDHLNWSELANSIHSYSSYDLIIDTQFVHSSIDTRNLQHSYRVKLSASNGAIFTSDSSQSIFLTTMPADQSITLKWNANTSWTNYQFDIYRYNEVLQKFDSIGSTTSQIFKDLSLTNDSMYCYYIKSYGSYGLTHIENPLINNSNISCTKPTDNQAPCCPVLKVTGPCDETQNIPTDIITNKLMWNNPNLNCAFSDAIGYKLYAIQSGNIILISEIKNINQTSFEHLLSESIPTCYFISAYDSNLNECIPTDTVCVSYCPYYKLPNTFTPNNDGQNDIFKPYPYRFIDKIDLTIFNRWGNIIYQTHDPDINWNGSNLNGKLVSDGVYYYQCIVHYKGLSQQGLSSETLTGFIELLSGKN